MHSSVPACFYHLAIIFILEIFAWDIKQPGPRTNALRNGKMCGQSWTNELQELHATHASIFWIDQFKTQGNNIILINTVIVFYLFPKRFVDYFQNLI